MIVLPEPQSAFAAGGRAVTLCWGHPLLPWALWEASGCALAGAGHVGEAGQEISGQYPP